MIKKTFQFIVFLLLLNLPCKSYTQSNIDSLKILLNTAKSDTVKINALLELSWELKFDSPDTAIKFANEALFRAKKNNYDRHTSNAMHNLGTIHIIIGKYEEAKEFISNSLVIRKELNDKKGMASSYGNLGIIYDSQGNFERAFDNYFKSLQIQEELGNKKGLINSYGNIGILNAKHGHYQKGLEYLNKSLELSKEINDMTGIANATNNIGNIQKDLGNLSEALESYLFSIKTKEENNIRWGLADSYNNIGSIYRTKGRNDESFIFHKKALELQEAMGDQWGISNTYNLTALSYIKTNEFKNAKELLYKSIVISKKIGAAESIKDSYEFLFEIFEIEHQCDSALKYHKLFLGIKDSLIISENSRMIADMEVRYESIKKENEIKVLQKDKELSKAELSQKNLILWFSLIGITILILFSFIITNRLSIMRRQKSIIEKQKLQVGAAYNELNTKNSEILDSIRYAKRIQEAILPSMSAMEEALREGFVLYKPKDVVAGDFFWMEQVAHFSDKGGGIVYFAAADCTGHGVPGAMVSVVCSNALSKALLEEGVRDTGKLLDRTREIVIHRLAKSGGEVKDGMDISLCSIDFSRLSLQWSGANNPLWLVRNGVLYETKPDKQPIGIHENSSPFVAHQFELQKGDNIYIFTDGFQDQFGGEKNKKFMTKKLKKLILDMHHEKMDAQKIILDNEFEKWRGNHEQVDDVCFIGVRIK